MKRLKMVLYGEPGVGKSTFACKAPKPFFITTDGNYEWLEDFGAKEEDHKQVYSWDEAKKLFTELTKPEYDKYETIVLDLAEDLFKWDEAEFCKRSRIEHVSDVGYGKAYDITRNEYFLEICKLLALPKHIILIMHGITFTVKDRRGVEHTKYGPTSRMPDKLLDMIEGRVRYFLRCYLKGEEQGDGVIVKKRYLSLIPKENEFGIARGLDEAIVPHDIPLDFPTFAKYVGIDMNTTSVDVKVEKKPEAKPEVKPEVKDTTLPKDEAQVVIEEVVQPIELSQVESVNVDVEAAPVEEVVQPEPVKEAPKALSNEDKLAAIKAKLAAIKAAQNK